MPTPLPVLPATYYCQLWGTSDGRRHGITLCLVAATSATTAPADLTRCTNLAGFLCTAWDVHMASVFPNQLTGWDARVYGLEFPTNPAGIGHATGGGTAAVSCEAAPAAAVIRHVVTRRGRGSQSHNNLSPIPRDWLDATGQNIQAGHVTQYTTAWSDFIDAVQTATLSDTPPWDVTLRQLSRKGAGATYPITDSFCDPVVGTERSRTARP